jgi:heptosyltransferase II
VPTTFAIACGRFVSAEENLTVMAVSFHPTPKRILVRGVNWLGDAVMTTPALMRLRERFLDAHITLLTPEKLRELWTLHPAVDEVIGFAASEGVLSVAQRLRKASFIEGLKTGRAVRETGLTQEAALAEVKKLRPAVFDLALVLPNSPRSALEVWLAGIPQRIGYARPWRNWFLTQAVATRPSHVRMRKRPPNKIRELVEQSGANLAAGTPVPASAHQLHEYLHLIGALGASPEPVPPCLVITAAEAEATARKFGLMDALKDARPVLGLNPGAEYGSAKRWPADKFVAAANGIQKLTNCDWVILGGKGDVELAGKIASGVPAATNLAGNTSLRELMALLKLCRGLLTNDTGPMHVAAALGTPVVVPFGSTSPELTGPGLPGDTRHRLLKSDAVCSPCFLRECPIDFRCMKGITVERVTAAALDVFRH